MNNKRIHELLESFKAHSNNPLIEKPSLFADIVEAMQYLLEENIEYRKIKETWESDLSIHLNGLGLKKEKQDEQ